jgi:pimeloyl-ACP methyl ester carboxylesterase
MTADGKSFNDYAFGSEFSTGMLPSLLIGDPRVTGALRFDFRSGDPAYRARTKASFAADVDDLEWEAAAHLLTPDTPATPMAERISITANRWGSVPRTYICCTADHAVPIAAQRRFIGEADAATPGNLTDVRELATSHSPFLSQPEEVARILLAL